VIVQEGYSARWRESSHEGTAFVESVVLLSIASLVIFIASIRPFSRIAMNSAKFDLDATCTMNSKQFAGVRDRWRDWKHLGTFSQQ
jgi:hypothetical protein